MIFSAAYITASDIMEGLNMHSHGYSKSVGWRNEQRIKSFLLVWLLNFDRPNSDPMGNFIAPFLKGYVVF